MSKAKLAMLKVLTPMHVGGSSGNGIADLTVQREGATSIPKIESTAIKSVLNLNSGQNKIAYTDFKMLFFPISSSNGIFSLISCPYVLERFFEENEEFNNTIEGLLDLVSECGGIGENLAFVFSNDNEDIYLAEYKFRTVKIEATNCFEKMEALKGFGDKIIFISNENFISFVNYYTDIVTRIRVNKKSSDESLYSQEYIADESIFYGFLCEFKDINKESEYKLDKMEINNRTIQIGGAKSLYKGVAKIYID